MIPKRLSAKVFARTFTDSPKQIDLAHVVPVFQRWIQEKTLEGMLIDVADYKHVYQGPGVLLVAHEGDYAFDTGNGRAGVKYIQKRDWKTETVADALRHVARLAFDAAVKLEQESAFSGIGFDSAEIEFTFLDRLTYPNTPEAFEVAQQAVREFAAHLFGEVEVEITSSADDPREPLTITLKVPSSATLAALLERLQVGAPVSSASV